MSDRSRSPTRRRARGERREFFHRNVQEAFDGDCTPVTCTTLILDPNGSATLTDEAKGELSFFGPLMFSTTTYWGTWHAEPMQRVADTDKPQDTVVLTLKGKDTATLVEERANEIMNAFPVPPPGVSIRAWPWFDYDGGGRLSLFNYGFSCEGWEQTDDIGKIEQMLRTMAGRDTVMVEKVMKLVIVGDSLTITKTDGLKLHFLELDNKVSRNESAVVTEDSSTAGKDLECYTPSHYIMQTTQNDGFRLHGLKLRSWPDCPFFITNVGKQCFLDSHGEQVHVWGDGFQVGEVPDNLKWKLKPIAGERNTFYIVHDKFNKFLDSYGQSIKLWGDGVNIGEVPDNIKWRREPVKDIPDAFYLIHKATNKFLDTHGVPAGRERGKVSLWGDGNTAHKGKYPKNLQWRFNIP